MKSRRAVCTPTSRVQKSIGYLDYSESLRLLNQFTTLSKAMPPIVRAMTTTMTATQLPMRYFAALSKNSIITPVSLFSPRLIKYPEKPMSATQATEPSILFATRQINFPNAFMIRPPKWLCFYGFHQLYYNIIHIFLQI